MIWKFLSDVIKPVTALVDDLHTSDEEKMTLRLKMMELENAITNRVLEYEKELLTSQSQIITAEAKGDSWLQRSWRPITMLTFLCLVVGDAIGILANPLSAEAWVLLKIGLGGYVVGRSGEKITKHLKGGNDGGVH